MPRAMLPLHTPFRLCSAQEGSGSEMPRQLLLLLPLLWAGSLAVLPDFQLAAQESVVVQEGHSAFIPCTLSYPMKGWRSSTPAWGYWFKKGSSTHRDPAVATNNPDRAVRKETRERFQLLGDPRAYNCSLGIRDAQRGDAGVYFFRVERGTYVKYDYRHSPLYVFVIEAPSIHIPGTLETGRPRTVTCTVPRPCDQRVSPTFSWIGVNLTSSLGPRAPCSSALTLSPQPRDHGTHLTCQVTFLGAGVTMNRTVKLNVSYAPQSLSIQAFQGNDTGPKALADGSSLHVQEGQALRLVCVADSNPPASLSWTRGSLALQPSERTDSSVLELPWVDLKDDGKYVCRAQHWLGSRSGSVSLVVQSSLQLLGPACSWEAGGLHCNCSARAWPAPSLRWRLGRGLLQENSSNASFTVISSSLGPWANSSLSLREGLCSSLRLSCEAWSPRGSQRATVLVLPGKPAPRTEAVQGAFGGAGVTLLLAVCLCLIFFMLKLHRRKAAGKGASGDNGAQPGTGAIHLGHQDHANRAPAQCQGASEEGQELHYASLSFHGMRPREPWHREDCSTTVYSEIRIRE